MANITYRSHNVTLFTI